MNSALIIKNILNSSGKFVRARWKSNASPAAQFKDKVLEKVTSATVRAGINYANLSENKEKETKPLPKGQEWFKFPYIIKSGENLLVRLYPTKDEGDVTFFVDGREVSKQEYASFLSPGDAKKLDEKRPCFVVKMENILDTVEE